MLILLRSACIKEWLALPTSERQQEAANVCMFSHEYYVGQSPDFWTPNILILLLKQLTLPSLPTAWPLCAHKRNPWASEISLRLLLLSLKTVSRASFLHSHVRGELSMISATALINLFSPRRVEKGSQAEDISPPQPRPKNSPRPELLQAKTTLTGPKSNCITTISHLPFHQQSLSLCHWNQW